MPPMPLHRPRRIRATSERFPDDEPERERRGLAGCGNENNYKNRRIERVAVSLSVLGLGVGCRLEPPQVSSGLRSFSPAGLKPPCGARALGARIDRWVVAAPSPFALRPSARLARCTAGRWSRGCMAGWRWARTDRPVAPPASAGGAADRRIRRPRRSARAAVSVRARGSPHAGPGARRVSHGRRASVRRTDHGRGFVREGSKYETRSRRVAGLTVIAITYVLRNTRPYRHV